MKKVCIIGHFGEGKNLINGQSIKTKILAEELIRCFGNNNIQILDTYGPKSKVFRLFFQVAWALHGCENIIILPAHNGVRIIPRFLRFWNWIYKRKIHYDVVGGWLPTVLEKSPGLLRILSEYEGIYVEVESMRNRLNVLGLRNVYVVPNCKRIDIIRDFDIDSIAGHPIRICTFSRVMKEKGIEEAVHSIERINKEQGASMFSLDIYGQVDEKQKDWFCELQSGFPENVRYCGVVDFNKSTAVLKDYHVLLFPTFYAGEGFAGTIIDAMAAGVPVIASDWNYNKDIITEGYNGYIFETHNIDQLIQILSGLDISSCEYLTMKKNCITAAEAYLPENALNPIIERL